MMYCEPAEKGKRTRKAHDVAAMLPSSLCLPKGGTYTEMVYISGCKYTAGDVLILLDSSSRSGYKLIQVKYFWIDEADNVSLIGKHLRVLMLDDHYQAYLVTEEGMVKVPASLMADIYPLPLYTVKSQKFVPLHHAIPHFHLISD